MKNCFLLFLILAINLLSIPAMSQAGADTTVLGLPGDNLDLYAVLDLFQKSKTIEDFEKSLNEEETGINNLDLNLDGKIDFIKVVTKQDNKDFTFVLQDDISGKEIQDVAVILVSKDEKGKVSMQIVGDKELYGDNYVIEPKPPAPAVTVNPAYTGPDPVIIEPTTNVVVVQSAPIVHYVYSPAYVPYTPPYYYGYYPPYFRAAAVVAVGIYRHNNYYNHYGYQGGNNTININNNRNYDNYNDRRNNSETVNRNNANGNYERTNQSNRSSNGSSASERRSASSSTDQSRGSSTNQSRGNSDANRQSRGSSSASGRSSNSQSRGASTGTNRSSNQSRGSSASRYNSSSMSASRAGGRRGGGGRRR